MYRYTTEPAVKPVPLSVIVVAALCAVSLFGLLPAITGTVGLIVTAKEALTGL